MIRITNKHIPFKDFGAMTIWPFLFVRSDYKMSWKDENHESIHGDQQVEVLALAIILAIVLFTFGCGWWSLLILPLYLYIYVGHWLILWAKYRDRDEAYYGIIFEKEAYDKEKDFLYLNTRAPFAWLKYI